ncbi:glutamyl-tRNA(Gln) amidotransferase subunit E [bacterium BMS3Abin07]|nr:glutamyl-tRNA(Gln) amidotransferase subunit E [bacterium BMS3Abin07]HDO22814.1 GatB/YqeY domain-containing protein [Nitrospirota bacterium]
MYLLEKIDSDLRTAMKSSDRVAVLTLRNIKSAVRNREIEKGGKLSDEEICSVLSTLVKQRKESMEQFSRGGRDDLVESEKAELSVLQKYLPKQIPEKELLQLIGDTIRETGATGTKDIGKVMKSVMPKVRGRADGKVVNREVSRLLAG